MSVLTVRRLPFLPTSVILSLIGAMTFTGCDLLRPADQEDDLNGQWRLLRYEANGTLLANNDSLYIDIEGRDVLMFDYQGDAFNNGPECWTVIEFDRVSLGGDRYRLIPLAVPEAAERIHTAAVGDTLTVTFEDREPNLVETYARSEQEESSFTPLCTQE